MDRIKTINLGIQTNRTLQFVVPEVLGASVPTRFTQFALPSCLAGGPILAREIQSRWPFWSVAKINTHKS